MAYVYRHIRLDKNEPFYIGIGSDERHYRTTAKSHRNKIWKGIVSRSEYRVEILLDDISFDEAKEKEKEFIALYGRINLNTGTLCNLTDGGDGTLGQCFSDEHREKISKANKGRKLTEEHKKKLRESGRDWSLTQEQKDIISKKLKGRKKKYNETPRGLSHGTAKIVLDTETGVFYTSVLELSKVIGLNLCTLRYNLKNKNNYKYQIV
jgi:hypothetical protein